MKVVMVTGSIPPDACGVGDYTFALTNELQKQGVNVEFVRLNIALLIKLLKPEKDRVIHLQYPTQGYGHSLLPLLLVILKKPIITLHEYSQVHPLRKLSESLMLFFSSKIIITTDYEREAVSNFFFNIKRNVLVIPVFSAFAPENMTLKFKKRNGIVFFGLMRPNKGIEEFIKLARLLKKRKSILPVNIYSAIPNGGLEYLKTIQQSSLGLNINWHINEKLEDVSKGMNDAKYAYLDFPDGVSERRSSFMAAISHGLLVFSKVGMMTPERLKPSFINVATAEEVVDEINFFENNHEDAMEISKSAKNISKDYSVVSIAKLHSEIYKSVV